MVPNRNNAAIKGADYSYTGGVPVLDVAELRGRGGISALLV